MAATARSAPPMVLVADDAVTVRLFYRSVLEPLGVRVTEAWNGAEALEHALRQTPDLVLADVNMPHLDGYGLVRALRAEPSLAAVPVVMISTETAEGERNAARRAGANFYMVKPPRPDRLAAVVRLLAGQPGPSADQPA